MNKTIHFCLRLPMNSFKLKNVRNVLLTFFLSINLSVIAAETHLVCDGETTTHVIGMVPLAPDIKPITITFDEKNSLLESELLFPTCDRSQDQIDKCKCTFEKTNISCGGLSKNKNEPKNIWYFQFNLNRISGKLNGVRQFNNSGELNKFSQNSSLNYICKQSPIKF